MLLPTSIRNPSIIEGPRGSGTSQKTQYYLLTDLSHPPRSGEHVYLSPHEKLNLLLRSEKVRKDSGGQILGIIDPLSAQFENGKFVTTDGEVSEILDKHKARGVKFFKYDDVVELKKNTDMEAAKNLLATASPEVLGLLQQQLGEKSFSLPDKKK